MPICDPWKIFGRRLKKQRQYAKREFPNVAAGSERDAAKFMLEADRKFDGLLEELFGADEIAVTPAVDIPQSGIKIFGVEYGGVEFSGSYDRNDDQCVLTILTAWKKAGPEIDVRKDRQLFKLEMVSDGRYRFEGKTRPEDYDFLVEPYLEKPDISSERSGMLNVKGEIGKPEAIGPIIRKAISYG